MNNENIKDEIEKLKGRINKLENHSSNFNLKGGDPWNGQPRVMDGLDSYFPKHEHKYEIENFPIIKIS